MSEPTFTLPVRSLDAAVAFYRELLDREPAARTAKTARFDLGEASLCLVHTQAPSPPSLSLPGPRPGTHVDPDGHVVELRAPTRTLRGPTTAALHTGVPRTAGAVVSPIHRSTVFELGEVKSYGDIVYPRLANTPTHASLHAALAALEGTAAALSFASGMAAISTTLLSLLRSGDHLLAARTLYGGTSGLLREELPAYGIGVGLIDATTPEGWAAAVRPETRVLYVETVSNPLLDVADLESLLSFGRSRGLLTVVDNTFLSPVNLRPAALGFDLVVHSATKYLGGHSDVCAGAVAGSTELVGRIWKTQHHLGGTLDPQAAWLLERGLKTLALRVDRQNQSALRLARFLSAHPAVREVRYPGLRQHPGHDRARRWFRGFGGMLALRPADPERFLSRLRLPTYAASLGGVESLVVVPARSSHMTVPEAERVSLGITDDLVRLSVGCEETEDLLADVAQALD